MKKCAVTSLKSLTEKILSEGLHDVKLQNESWKFLLCISNESAEHLCKGSLMRCCNVFRCEPCHLDHMHSSHSEIATQTFEKLHSSRSIIRDITPVRASRTCEEKISQKAQKQQQVVLLAAKAAILRSSPSEVNRLYEMLQNKLQERRKNINKSL